MSLQTFKNQLWHEVKASWQKTAVLAVLLLIGLVFWLPPLVRAVMGSPVKKAGATATPAVASTTVKVQAAVAADGSVKEAEFTWQQGEKQLRTDPLVRSVEVAAIHGDPFHLDRDQFPPPVLFEEEAPRDISLSNAPQTDSRLGDKLVLKSTIVGLKRRAALINDKLYYEGRKIQVDGETYLLTAVYPRRVLLTQGETVFELVIPSAFQEGSDDSE